MGGGYVANAGVFLVNTIFGVLIIAVVLRFLLQWVRADFYNPISQAIVKVTSPALRRLRRFIPAVGHLDTASVVLMLALQMLNTYLVLNMIGYHSGPVGVFIVAIAELLSKIIYVLMFAVIIQVIVSWVSPGAYNPVLSLVDSLTTPVMRPARRLIPPIGGLDLSPMVAIVALQLLLMLVVAPLKDIGATLL